METTKERMSSRRFILSLIFSIGGTVGLYIGKLNSPDYYLLAAAVLGGYAAIEYTKKKSNV